MTSTAEETIAAIATATGPAGVSVIRISGADAFAVADRMVLTRGAPPSRRDANTFFHAKICIPDGEVVDDALVLIMQAPRSYTGEHVVEIQGHGGDVQARRLLHCALAAGARPAEPGEFTRRAFLNGRIDLLQAEAVLDLIRARSDRAAASAIEQLQGRLSTEIDSIYDQLVSISADLEATLDFPEDELPDAVLDDVRTRFDAATKHLDQLLATWTDGRLLREGAAVVIAGRPNVGKSTLLNALLGTDRAIVAELPGTTRDTIEESFVIEGIPIRLVDTAGFRDADCVIEREGIRRSREQLDRADLYLYLLSAPDGLTADDRALLDGIDPEKLILIANKSDLLGDAPLPDIGSALPASLLRGQGLDAIRSEILRKLRGVNPADDLAHAAISERHRHLLIHARHDLDHARDLLVTGLDEHQSLACSHLSHALHALGDITGRAVHNDLLDAIFSRFCIGK